MNILDELWYGDTAPYEREAFVRRFALCAKIIIEAMNTEIV